MAGDLFGLSAADRDVLLRMIARERSNYSANVRNLAPVPREKNIWKPSTNPKVAWLSTARTSYTYTGGGAEKEVQFTGAWNASDGEFDTLQTVPSSGYYTKIELTKPGIYETHAHVAFDSSGWSYTTISSSLGDAFDEASLRIEAKDKNGDTIDATLKRQWTIVLSNYKFSLSTGGIMLLNILPTLFPVTVRVLAFSNTYDFTAQAVSGSFYVKSIREELD